MLGSSLIVNALLARLLSQDDMGAYFIILSLVSLFATIAALGMGFPLVRSIAENMGSDKSENVSKIICASMKISFISCAVLSFIMYSGLGRWLALDIFKCVVITGVLWLIILCGIVDTFRALISQVFRGFHDIRNATLFSGVIAGLLSAIFFLTLKILEKQSTLNHVMLLSLTAGLISTLIAGFTLSKKIKGVKGEKRASDFKGSDLLSVSWPLWINGLAFFILTQAGMWILAFYQPKEDVALFGAAVRLGTFITMPLLFINAVTPPIIAELNIQGKLKEMEQTLRGTATIAGIPALLIVLIFSIFADDIMGIVYGHSYRAGGIILVILSMGNIVNVLTGSCGLTLVMTGHEKTMTVISIFSGVVNIFLALFLVQKAGLIGIALASSCSLLIQNGLMLQQARIKCGLWTFMDLKKIPVVVKIYRQLKNAF